PGRRHLPGAGRVSGFPQPCGFPHRAAESRPDLRQHHGLQVQREIAAQSIVTTATDLAGMSNDILPSWVLLLNGIGRTMLGLANVLCASMAKADRMRPWAVP